MELGGGSRTRELRIPGLVTAQDLSTSLGVSDNQDMAGLAVKKEPPWEGTCLESWPIWETGSEPGKAVYTARCSTLQTVKSAQHK